MAKFIVGGHRYIEQTCELVVEACSAQEAVDIALRERLDTVAWCNGEDFTTPVICSVEESRPASVAA